MNVSYEAGKEAVLMVSHVGIGDSVLLTKVSRFPVRDHFKPDVSPFAPIQIYYVSCEFKEAFLDIVEKEVSADELLVWPLTQRIGHKDIFERYAPVQPTSFAHINELLKLQPNGEKGILLVNSSANIFYVDRKKGDCWTIWVRWWKGCGWFIRTCPATAPFVWSVGDQVLLPR